MIFSIKHNHFGEVKVIQMVRSSHIYNIIIIIVEGGDSSSESVNTMTKLHEPKRYLRQLLHEKFLQTNTSSTIQRALRRILDPCTQTSIQDTVKKR